jgi:polyisoprenoid-binding protein YceI
MEKREIVKWAIDKAHTEINFKAKHLVIATVTGSFTSFDGTVYSTNENFDGASVEFSADVNSINTNQEYRDNHLKSADFFDAENHPKMTFKSTEFKKVNDSEAVLTGDLTIRGVTKSVDLKVDLGGQATDPYGNVKAGFELNGRINRKDYGLTWNALTESGGLVVGDEIKIIANVELLKQKPELS